jgi:hypothetical protein
MNEHFYNGFIKRAEQHGIHVNEAEAIYKLASPIPIPPPFNLPRVFREAAGFGRGWRDARESMKRNKTDSRMTPEIKAQYPDAQEWADLPKDVRWGGLEGRREYNQLREEEQGAISDFVPPPRLPMPVGPRLRVPGS